MYAGYLTDGQLTSSLRVRRGITGTGLSARPRRARGGTVTDANGTSSTFARVFAINVLPVPVGPLSISYLPCSRATTGPGCSHHQDVALLHHNIVQAVLAALSTFVPSIPSWSGAGCSQEALFKIGFPLGRFHPCFLVSVCLTRGAHGRIVRYCGSLCPPPPPRSIAGVGVPTG